MSEEVRDTPAPYEPSRATGSIVPPVPHDFMHAEPDRKLSRWLWAGVGVCILILAGISIARAAETPARWEITLFHAGKDYGLVAATHRVLATYDSREECRVMITRVRVHVSGARLVCAPAETRRVR